MNAEEMKVIDRGTRQSVWKRKREQVGKRRLNADCANGNRDGRLRRPDCISWRSEILSRDEQGEIVGSIVLQRDQLGKFDHRESAEQQSRHNYQLKPTASWAR